MAWDHRYSNTHDARNRYSETQTTTTSSSSSRYRKDDIYWVSPTNPFTLEALFAVPHPKKKKAILPSLSPTDPKPTSRTNRPATSKQEQPNHHPHEDRRRRRQQQQVGLQVVDAIASDQHHTVVSLSPSSSNASLDSLRDIITNQACLTDDADSTWTECILHQEEEEDRNKTNKMLVFDDVENTTTHRRPCWDYDIDLSAWAMAMRKNDRDVDHTITIVDDISILLQQAQEKEHATLHRGQEDPDDDTDNASTGSECSCAIMEAIEADVFYKLALANNHSASG